MSVASIVESYSACGDVDVLLVELRPVKPSSPRQWAVVEIAGDDEARVTARRELERGRLYLHLLGEVRWFSSEAEAQLYMAENER